MAEKKEEKGLICPLSFAIQPASGPLPLKGVAIKGPTASYCIEESCAWYIDGQCAVAIIARDLEEIKAPFSFTGVRVSRGL